MLAGGSGYHKNSMKQPRMRHFGFCGMRMQSSRVSVIDGGSERRRKGQMPGASSATSDYSVVDKFIVPSVFNSAIGHGS